MRRRVYKFVHLVFCMAVRNIVLGIGIFVVYLLMLAYGIEAFYPSPRYDQFCTGGETRQFYLGKPYPIDVAQCTLTQQIREQTDACYASEGQPVYEYNNSGCMVALKECNYCNKEFNEAVQAHGKSLFVIALIAGIITLLIGYHILKSEPVGSALMASGIGAIFYGSVRNWENLSDIWRFLLLLAALILLILITVRVNRVGAKKRWMFWK